MKPYYEEDGVTIYCDDFRNAGWLVSEKAVLMTDPPYGIDYDPQWLNNLYKAPLKTTKKVIGDHGLLELSSLFNWSRRLVWGFPYIYDAKAIGWLVWDKQPGINNPRALMTPVEMASTTLWRGFRLVRCMWGGYYRDDGEQRFEHPTQKPLKVFLYSIANFTEKEDLIIDLFLGTGTCAVAAKKLNRKFIGYEIEEKYCEIAANRCRQMVMDLRV